MHIPDGYLSPETCAATLLITVPSLALAARRVGEEIGTRQVPALALFSSSSFLIMMLNLPVPGGTTAHAVGAVIIGVVLGPWAAMIAVAVALLFQALLFDDGGILTWGANVLNMAILMPIVGLAVYRLLSKGSMLNSRRRTLAAALGGYTGMLAAALAVAVELGIQPAFFHSDDGTPLYSPYSLSQTLPAMLVAHLLVAGPAEALLTGALLTRIARTRPSLLLRTHTGLIGGAAADGAARAAKAPRSILALIALAPLGMLAKGTAFAEDAPEDLSPSDLGLNALPSGMTRYAEFWNHALLSGYGADGPHPVLAYWGSAILGTLTIGTLAMVIMRLVRHPAGRAPHSSPPHRPTGPNTAIVASGPPASDS
ncbi:cobalt transporter CbiM [Actinomyces gaoshouyii]|uniref:Cobalt transporter CbiM n=1 Tax=Actinomyces gaoshouyii TaxID=1960083 RepID=A0A8H9H8C9_9ACTO|nr:cobalt transporter CbiM [Actinomyces gaoshouyii]ARD42048.1 hypothetical protein B6G06_06595 [Actinomyces gaoshouyii]GGO96761.1 cobalt transporter CbiM [Actinomyces gaoshouyii]